MMDTRGKLRIVLDWTLRMVGSTLLSTGVFGDKAAGASTGVWVET